MKQNSCFRIALISVLLLYLNINTIINGQNILLKGQFWSNNLFSDAPLKTQSSFESQLGYIPTISVINYLSNKRLIGISL